MTARDDRRIEFRRLTEVPRHALVALLNDPDVRRHLPLARGRFEVADGERFVAAKERMWEETGYGPWAFVRGEELVGWGGLQPEGEDADVGLVLHRAHWGAGRELFERIVAHAFDGLGLESVTALLPPSRSRVAGLRRLGFREDGELRIGGEVFRRFRLSRRARR